MSQINICDFVVTIAMSSMPGSTIPNQSVKLVDGLLGMELPIPMQYITAWLPVHNRSPGELFNNEPGLFLHHGSHQERELHRVRVTHSEVKAALRGKVDRIN